MKSGHHSTAPENSITSGPIIDDPGYCLGGKLVNRRALTTGGESGIGRAVAILFAEAVADVVAAYAKSDRDAKKTMETVRLHGRHCFIFKCDISREMNARKLVKYAEKSLGCMNVLVHNAGIKVSVDGFENIKMKNMEQIFRTNIFAIFYVTQAALSLLRHGSTIINTTSVTAYRGSDHLVDYSSTKGTIVAFTSELALSLVKQNVRVNGVAPGPIWTPLIVAIFSRREQAKFGKRCLWAGQPSEVAPCYVFLASGLVLHDSTNTTPQRWRDC